MQQAKATDSGRLILVEGLPGSGKSTTSSHIAAWLRAAGRSVELLPEKFTGHPLNVGDDLHPSGDETGERFWQRYTPDSFVQESTDRWHRFVSQATTRNTVYVVDSHPYQSGSRILWQLAAPADQVVAYTRGVERLAMSLSPQLIYLAHTSVDERTRATMALRGPKWTAYAVQVITSSPYAKRHGITGLDGALRLLNDYAGLLDSLAATTILPHLVVTDVATTWQQCAPLLREYLGID